MLYKLCQVTLSVTVSALGSASARRMVAVWCHCLWSAAESDLTKIKLVLFFLELANTFLFVRLFVFQATSV